MIKDKVNIRSPIINFNIIEKINKLKQKLKQLFKIDLTQKLFIITTAFIFALLIVIINIIYQFLDSKSYDLMMKYIKKPIKQEQSLLLVDIDDNSYNMDFTPNKWPWPRYIHGDALEVFADFNAKAVIYDIEFLGDSVAGVKKEEINQTKNHIMNKFNELINKFERIPDLLINDPSTKKTIIDGFNKQLAEYYISIDNRINEMLEDNDTYFAKRIRYNGKVYGTVNMLEDPNFDSDDMTGDKFKTAAKNLSEFGFKKTDLLKGKKSHPSIQPANISEFPEQIILENFKGVGFTKVNRDIDAAIRNISLFMEKDGYVIPQLAITPLLDIYNIAPDKMDFSSRFFVKLKDIEINGKKKTIRIPIVNGNMKINWPSGEFNEIFTRTDLSIKDKKQKVGHLSYSTLLFYKYVILETFSFNMSALKEFPSDEAKEIAYGYEAFLEDKKMLVENHTLTDENREILNAAYEKIFNDVLYFCSDENKINIYKDIDILLEGDPNATPELAEETKNQVDGYLETIKESTLNVMKVRKEIKENLEGKICFIGHTATGTTDLGSTPFSKKFENVGTHPAVFNTIIQNNFITIIPKWYIFAFCVIFYSLIVWFLLRKKAILTGLIGFGSTLVFVIVIGILYRLTNVYASPIMPFFYGFITFVIMILLKFILTEQEKGQIRNAFDKYLSPEYINEILKNPEKLELGGIRTTCTAMFTDIEKFSAISEEFMNDPKGLVNLLKDYLGTMSDIILDNKGTIDKYEGDAIIAFFGEPLKLEDHAFRACLSSLRMKEIEKQLNKLILDSGIIDRPLMTRIGINTGEMFVGNMGTANKFNYTVMGHAVNLAARLEGVNKLYGSYQLISEYTYKDIKDKIICRELDKVRVVNIKTPIRLYELIALKEEIKPEIKEALEIFHKALKAFEKKNWKEALDLFNKGITDTDIDSPTKVFIDRCRKYIKKEPPVDWDGVYNLTKK